MADVIRVLIVDDHDVVREGLKSFFAALDDIVCVGDAASGEEALTLYQALQPDVVVMDVAMPGMDGIATTQALLRLDPAAQIVILTSFGDEALVQKALTSGAMGYLLKNASVREVAAAVRAAYEGKAMLSPEATQALIQSKSKPTYHLRERELEVLRLMTAGLTNEQIAHQTHLSRSTVKFHVSAILSKLGVESRTEAVAVAIREKLVDGGE